MVSDWNTNRVIQSCAAAGDGTCRSAIDQEFDRPRGRRRADRGRKGNAIFALAADRSWLNLKTAVRVQKLTKVTKRQALTVGIPVSLQVNPELGSFPVESVLFIIFVNFCEHPIRRF